MSPMRVFVASPQAPKALALLAFNGPWSLILQSVRYLHFTRYLFYCYAEEFKGFFTEWS